MNFSASETTAPYAELLLQTTPPRPPRHQLARPRLGLDDEQFREHSVIVVQAPPGFGKTSLLGQWRREYLARGAAVAWVSADERDDLQRFLHCLVLAVRSGCARPAFGRFLMESGGAPLGDLEGITAWLAEVAQTSLDLVLIIDEAERLAPSCFAALTYLLHNVAPNLRVVVGARGGFDPAIADLVAYGQCLQLGPEALRFRLDETLALVRNRFTGKGHAAGPAAVSPDTAARLHDLTEGWPLGLQLALAAMERGKDPQAAMASLAATGATLPNAAIQGGRSEHFVGGLLANLTAEDADFLTRIAIVDRLHPTLCQAITGRPDAAAQLARLSRDTPVFVVSDESDWCRLHTLARDALRTRCAALPAAEQRELHLRAMAWLADHHMLEEAARHAHAAGEREQAYDLAEQCLYEAVTQGHQESVLDWLELLPAAELDRRPRLRLAAAWALAVSERHAEAETLIGQILATPVVDDVLRYECALIASGAAYYADEPDRCLALFAPFGDALPGREPSPLREARLLPMHANRLAMLAVLQGDPVQARRHLQAVPRGDFGQGYGYAIRWGALIAGASYLWEGQVLLCAETLRPAVASADAELGRRHPLACMLAALLASALYERDQMEEAVALLANRLDVLERVGSPETVLMGYRTAARIAAAQGVEHRALDLLEVLHAVGVSRRLPRLCIASLAEQVRLHASRFRFETCHALSQRIDEILAGSELSPGPLWRRGVDLLQHLAHAHTAFADQNWASAREALERAAPLAEALKQGRVRIEIRALQAFARDRLGEDSEARLREAMNLAQTYGLARTLVDAHPGLAGLVQRVAEAEAAEGGGPIAVASTARPRLERSAAAPRAVPSMVLTPKERKVLEYLARNLSNKEIAQAMEVGEETVKWHLKNLFGKLDAGTRKHVVRRAQLLGLLEGVD